MKLIQNDIASVHLAEEMAASVNNLCHLIRDQPFILEPFRGINEEAKKVFSSEGFQLYSTYAKTTLVYDENTNCFFKIIHPMTLKNRLFWLFRNRARSVYELSGHLLSRNIIVPRVTAYGRFKRGHKPFFAMKKIEGTSLYEIIKKKESIPFNAYLKIIDEVLKLHSIGYWWGDAHPAHIIIQGGEVSGMLDFEDIRRNRPFRVKNLVKDLAGLNHPELPLTKDEKLVLFSYYADKFSVRNRQKFFQLMRYYTDRRWKKG